MKGFKPNTENLRTRTAAVKLHYWTCNTKNATEESPIVCKTHVSTYQLLSFESQYSKFQTTKKMTDRPYVALNHSVKYNYLWDWYPGTLQQPDRFSSKLA